MLLEEISEKKSLDDLTRVAENDTDSVTTRVVDIDSETKYITDKKNQKIIMPRRSGRIKRPTDHYEANIVVPDTNDEDSNTYEEAMINTEKEK